jgi:hypothetical protein
MVFPLPGETGADFFRGKGLTAFGLGVALLETSYDAGAAGDTVLLVGLQQVKRAFDHVGRSTIGAAIELTLDALFGGGIEVKHHAPSIRPGWTEWKTRDEVQVGFPQRALRFREGR